MDERDDFEHIFQSKEDNVFDEFEKTPAEQYFIPEEKETEKEDIKADEFFDDSKKSENKPDETKRESFKNSSANKPKVHIPAPEAIAASSAVVIVSAAIIGIVPLDNSNNPSQINPYPYGELISENLDSECSISDIVIKGQFKNIDSSLHYFMNLSQQKENDILEESQEKELLFDETLTFSVKFSASYGLDSFAYQIFGLDNDGVSHSIYTSDLLPFTEDQNYQASYDKVKPTKSKIEFKTNGKYQIDVKTNFTTSYPDIYKYQFDVLDKNGKIYGTYLGTDSSLSIEIDPLDEIYFRYMDIGTFQGKTIEYNEYLITDASMINLPKVVFPDEFDFTGEYFALALKSQSVNENTSLNLTLSNGKETYKKEIPLSEEKIILELSDFEDEIGTLNITGEIVFRDEKIDSYEHRIPIQGKTYEMNYRFEVQDIQADFHNSGEDVIPVHYTFDYLLPNSYSIQFENENGTIYSTIPVTDTYTLSSLSSGDGGNIKISLLDTDGNKYKEVQTNNIFSNYQLDEITNNISDSFNAPNPNDSLITYNDDFTINIYRDMKTSSDTNLYYDSFICTGQEIDDTTSEVTYTGGIHHRSKDRISVMENVPMDQYVFVYYQIYKYQDVYYSYSKQQPSGNINLENEERITTTSLYDSVTDRTTVTILNNDSAVFQNKIVYDNKEYQYDNFNSFKESSYTLTLDGNAVNKNLIIYATFYDQNYDAISSLITLKGNRYNTYLVPIQE